MDPQLAIRRSLWRQRTPLHTAAKHGGILSISILVWAAQQIDEHTCYEMLNSADICGMTPLARAAKHGRLDIVRLLLDEGASPLIANRRGYTSLHLAALGCHHRVIDALLMATVDLGRLNGSTGSSRAYNVMIPTPFGDARYIDAASNDGFGELMLSLSLSYSLSCVCIIQSEQGQVFTKLLTLQIVLLTACDGVGIVRRKSHANTDDCVLLFMLCCSGLAPRLHCSKLEYGVGFGRARCLIRCPRHERIGPTSVFVWRFHTAAHSSCSGRHCFMSDLGRSSMEIQQLGAMAHSQRLRINASELRGVGRQF